jgi:hypothetical protein
MDNAQNHTNYRMTVSVLCKNFNGIQKISS